MEKLLEALELALNNSTKKALEHQIRLTENHLGNLQDEYFKLTGHLYGKKYFDLERRRAETQ